MLECTELLCCKRSITVNICQLGYAVEITYLLWYQLPLVYPLRLQGLDLLWCSSSRRKKLIFFFFSLETYDAWFVSPVDYQKVLPSVIIPWTSIRLIPFFKGMLYNGVDIVIWHNTGCYCSDLIMFFTCPIFKTPDMQSWLPSSLFAS